jgi:hypothetical protein
LIADHGGKPVVLVEGIGGGAGTGFLAQTKIHPAHHFALLVKVLKRLLHFAVENHPAIDLDRLLAIQVLRFADRWHGRAEITRNLITAAVAFAHLAHREAGPFQAVVGNLVRALLGKRQ